MALVDSRGRTINYLRLSVTDRCNMRCTYCMPSHGISKVAHADILTYEELHRIARTAVTAGIEKIRITGGEPLVRHGILDFLHSLAELPQLKQLVLTTNGSLLGSMAIPLKAAGVQRLNVSLDSLRPDVFTRITRTDTLKRVLSGIDAVRSCGLPVKINVVVMRGVNDDELSDFVDMAVRMACTVRFIEYMPTVRTPDWHTFVLPGAEILARLSERYDLLPLEPSPMAGPSRNFRIAGTDGMIGIITPISEHFCSGCNRIRVTSTGSAKGCLFDETRVELKGLLSSTSDLLLTQAIRMLVNTKPACHEMARDPDRHEAFSMASIGG